jgi:hypothetical protein
MEKIYTAPKGVSKFMRSDDFFRIIMGPLGSGKSTGCVMEVLRRCQQQKVGPDGFRRSRWAVVRNTRPQLKDTTLKTWFDWVPPGLAGKWKESEMVFYIELGDVRAEILFRPLDSPDDVQRVLSLELTGCWLNEAREIPQEIVEALQGRLKRYPSQSNGGYTWTGMIADTNPPEMDSYWARLIDKRPIDDNHPDIIMPCDSFKQPSGLAEDADNLPNLASDYYTQLAVGRPKAWVDTYVHGMYSPSLDGVPVYNDTFHMDRHVVSDLPIDPVLPIVVGLDFGMTPAASFKQYLPSGRIHTLRECVGFDMGLERLIKSQILPMINTTFPTNPLIFVGDPAGSRRADSDEGTCFKMLRQYFPREIGATVKPARTNDPNVRMQATENLLISYPDGQPQILYDRQCKKLVEGLRSRYRYPNVRNRDLTHALKPEKNDWSHIVEADQYANLFLGGGKFDISRYVRFDSRGGFHPLRDTERQFVTGPASHIGY